MILYQQLLDVSRSMLSMSQQEDWESFRKKEKEREHIIDQLKNEKAQSEVSVANLQELISIHQDLELITKKQRGVIKQSLIAIQKGKKANSVYQARGKTQ
ncbi:hypothetical protein AB835_03265 [Candidatus Endobugula sertula]|uniref:Flagellar protein FliT n=1 Tax=Candidatus Endobugula sertula TaxID=62101 RepID=A0A1D2QSD9_9GAMM|nr:hypothetical protein AB835_03265 [Candidatus Endobugula sertula]